MAGETPRRRLGASLVDLAAMAILLGVGVVGFGPVFGGTEYLVAGLGGVVIGLALAGLGARLGLGLVVMTLSTILAYLVFGAALALPQAAVFGVVPSLQSLHDLLLGSVLSWKQLLTVAVPVQGVPGLLIVPFLTALVCSVISGSLALRARRPAWALLSAAGMLVAAILFGTDRVVFPVAQGIVFTIVAVCWYAWRRAGQLQRSRTAMAGEPPDARAVGRLRLRRLVSATVLIAAAASVGLLTQGMIAPAEARQVLRTHVVPPLDIHDYASPLQSFRKYIRDGKVDKDVLFSVTGLPAKSRISLATLDAYDGVVYNVADGGGSGSGSFERLTGTVPAAVKGKPATITVTAGTLSGVWLPDVGYLKSLGFDGRAAGRMTNGLNYDPVTGVALSTAGLAKGDRYTMRTIVPESIDPTDADLASAKLSVVSLPKNQGVPQLVSSFAAKAVSDAHTPLDRLKALSSTLSSEGFFSHGLDGDASSRAGHGAERISAFLGGQQIVGDDEQYAVAMALMANQLGIPARVVMGFYPGDYSPNGTVNITGADLHAWVEAPFAGLGWVDFDPTPPENKAPDLQITKPKSDPKAQVLQPPLAPQPPVELPPDNDRKDGRTKVPGSSLDGLFAALGIGGISLAVLAVLFGPVLLIAGLKNRRRRRRARADTTADRLSGGWDEIVDTAADLGVQVAAGATRQEGARLLAERYPTTSIRELADRADVGVFGPVDPDAAEIAAFWEQVDGMVEEMTGSVGWVRRLRARVSLVTLVHPARDWLAQQRSRMRRRSR